MSAPWQPQTVSTHRASEPTMHQRFSGGNRTAGSGETGEARFIGSCSSLLVQFVMGQLEAIFRARDQSLRDNRSNPPDGRESAVSARQESGIGGVAGRRAIDINRGGEKISPREWMRCCWNIRRWWPRCGHNSI